MSNMSSILDVRRWFAVGFWDNYLMDAFPDHAQVDVIYLDFSIAFDRVNHKIILNDLL